MSYSKQMIATYPSSLGVDAGLLSATIDALHDCIEACNADVDADLSEKDLGHLVRCVRLCLDCVDICEATVGVVSRQAEYDSAVTGPLLQACVAICKSCGDECESHAQMHEHCKVCAEACHRCEDACRRLSGALG